MIDASERDNLASDLAIPLTQLGGLLCGMRKVTGATGDEWLSWIEALEVPANELGDVFEAALDGTGSYERVVDGRRLMEPRDRSTALQQALVNRIQAVVIQDGRPGDKLSPDGQLWSSDARRIADAVLSLFGISDNSQEG